MLRLLLSLAGVAIVTYTAYFIIPRNPTTVGFAYLLLVLVIASTWGLVEATLASIAATLAFDLVFLPPIGKFTIADPQNWVALFSFLATALITSRLSARVKKQALDAVDRQRDIERLYTFSRAILLIDPVEPIASFAIQGAFMQDSVLQGISNLIAIGLERSRAQDLAHQVEAARRSEQLRTTLIDAMAHEFKTPLTSIRAATTSLLSSPDQPLESRTELLEIADEEARHLQALIDDAVDMARLESNNNPMRIRREPTDPKELVEEVVASLHTQIDNRPVEIQAEGSLPQLELDRRLLKLALKQVLDNALKYSPPRSPVTVRVSNGGDSINFEITDHGAGIPEQEQGHLFERFYRSPSVKNQVPGFGLGLAIANNIVLAHHGELSVNSRPGETTFRMTLPLEPVLAGKGARQ